MVSVKPTKRLSVDRVLRGRRAAAGRDDQHAVALDPPAALAVLVERAIGEHELEAAVRLEQQFGADLHHAVEIVVADPLRIAWRAGAGRAAGGLAADQHGEQHRCGERSSRQSSSSALNSDWSDGAQPDSDRAGRAEEPQAGEHRAGRGDQRIDDQQAGDQRAPWRRRRSPSARMRRTGRASARPCCGCWSWRRAAAGGAGRFCLRDDRFR